MIRKWLKAGVLEEAGEVVHPATGTPQGGIISPVLSNVYLHYVLDLWTEKTVRKRNRGAMVYMRYADDFVVGFEYFNYYGVIGNSARLLRYWNASRRIIFRGLNRRSQRKSYNWTGFEAMWKTLAIPRPKIIETPYRSHQEWTLSYS